MTVSSWSQTSNNGGLADGYAVGPNSGCQGFDQNGKPVTLLSLMRLTTNTSTLTAQINAMVPMGGTYIPSGLFWGWETLSPNSVFTDNQASYTDPDVTKVVILLTDGCNSIANPNSDAFGSSGSQDTCGNYTGSPNYTWNSNQSYYQSTGYIWQNRLGAPPRGNSVVESDRATAADNVMTLMCSNMKANNILIYTIGIGPSGTYSPALATCASSSSDYYPISTPSTSLNATFAAIASQLTKVRIIPTSTPSD